jgi:hypothetical protein
MPELSQRTLGYVRDVLDEMEPEELDTPLELRNFWKRKLFDAGFPQQFIDIVATYQFDWVEIIPDLYSGKFGLRNQNANAYADPFGIGKEFLNKLVRFAVSVSAKTSIAQQLTQSLEHVAGELLFLPRFLRIPRPATIL